MFKLVRESSSKEILSQAIMSDQFQKNQDARNTIIRANDLFNELSRNNEVLVNISNNGETQLRIKLGDNSNGYVQVTVPNATNNLTSIINEVELNNENVVKLKEINDAINNF